jgi:hypothetical protein
MTTAVVVMPEYDFVAWLADTTQVLVADAMNSQVHRDCRYSGLTGASPVIQPTGQNWLGLPLQDYTVQR